MNSNSYPTSLRATQWLARASMLLSAVFAGLTWLMRDDIVLAWGERSRGAQRVLAEEGLEGLRAWPGVPDFVALAVVGVAVFIPLVWTLLALLNDRVIWTRPALSATLLFGVLVAVQGLLRDLPATFLMLSIAALGLFLAALVALWWPSTTAYLTDETLPVPAS